MDRVQEIRERLARARADEHMIGVEGHLISQDIPYLLHRLELAEAVVEKGLILAQTVTSHDSITLNDSYQNAREGFFLAKDAYDSFCRGEERT